MEAASVPQPQAPPGKRLTDFVGEQILWILLGGALLIMLVQDPARTLNNVVDGLSIGTIWALIALGYTLVYGIIELINFAHGEVFMIGSFVSVSLYATLGITESTGVLVLIFAMLLVLAISMVASGTLNVMIERVAYRPLRNAPEARAADHRDRDVVHPSERRPAVAPDARLAA